MASQFKNQQDSLKMNAVEDNFPLHLLVWYNDSINLNEKLTANKDEIEKKDPRGRTPLMLAVTLCHIDCVNVLTHHGASVNTETDGWSVVQEATATGNETLIKMVIQRRNYQRQHKRIQGMPQLLEKLKEAPDFYVEMKWEFSSWMPLVSKMCPSDTYKVYKQGSKVRIDSTLMGFDELKWLRGNTSIIFKGNEHGGTIIEIDHITRKVFIEQRHFVSPQSMDKNSPEMITTRLKNPIVTSFMDMEKICFERTKSGVWGWRQDKLENVNNYLCKVFSANNLDIVTKTRTEHIVKPNADNVPTSNEEFDDQASTSDLIPGNSDQSSSSLHNNITVDEYFTEGYDLGDRNIGKERKVSTKVRKFKANLYLCENYPLSLQEQIMPIVNLMATTSSYFSKLKDFIEMQLPSGFPVKIGSCDMTGTDEIPLFHVLNSSVTFENIFGSERSVSGVDTIEGDDKLMCFIDDSLFEPPLFYKVVDMRRWNIEEEDEEDDMLQFTLENSLFGKHRGIGGENPENKNQDQLWEPVRQDENIDAEMLLYEDHDMQKAIEDSLSDIRVTDKSKLDATDTKLKPSVSHNTEVLDDFEYVLAMSEKEARDQERQLKLEEETLRHVLEMSIKEK